jgi:ankyrin repeat protein
MSKYYDLRPLLKLEVDQGYTLAHIAAQLKHYAVLHYLIDVLEFDVDYYTPFSQQTLLHVIARFHIDTFTNKEKIHISNLIKKSNNLSLKNNYGKTSLQRAIIHNN